MAERLGVDPRVGNAELLAVAYRRWGLDLPRQVDGACALIVLDTTENRTIAVRDPLGAFPLFFTEAGGRLFLSTSIDALRNQPGVDRSLNRPALVDHLCHSWTDPHETFFAAIRRIPRGHLLLCNARDLTVTRYWEPVPSGKPVNWIAEDELQPRFEAAFETAVERAVAQGPTGIFLSGGLDSISVAAMAADVTRRDGQPLPRPFSLGFPDDADEEKEQRGVARALGLEHEFVPFGDAVPEGGLLASAVALSQEMPAPLLNTWMPAYTNLVHRAKRRGVRTILTGGGGDEWLSVTPTLAADLFRSFDIAGVARLYHGYRQSYPLSLPRTMHTVLWKYGLSPAIASVLQQIAPRRYTANRVRRAVNRLGSWAAPDSGLRAEVAARLERWLPAAHPQMGFYFRDTLNTMEHPLAAMEGEETFEMGRKLGMRFQHPYWDPGVADILYRTPPLLLFNDGKSKSVVRVTMARRFPGLGLEHQKKRAGTNFMSSILTKELPELWQRKSDLSALADLRVVEPGAVATLARQNLASGSAPRYAKVLDLINLESWVRAHH